MSDKPRLIERAFPLKQASLDSVHEKNVRHGHISTLHIWPARRPLAASRAALIATLLPDPGTPEERQKLCERIGGKVVQKIEKKKMPDGRTVERIKEETEGGILHWLGTAPASGGKKKKEEYRRKAEFYEKELDWFRQEIRKAYGGRAPRVLDPFAGGGAIPLEAMRLGCEVTAVDINPVAWFILKCTLEYPQKLAGKTHPLPDFILKDREFMTDFLVKGKGYSKARAQKAIEKYGHKNDRRHGGWLFESKDDGEIQADLAWHVRAWGKWVLNHARRDLAEFYPTYADFEPLKPGKAYEKQPMCLVPPKDDGTADIDSLNREFSEEYLADSRNPRWVAKPTVAYLWARTVTCKNCRASVPLLKTRWLCKKANKRVLLTMKPNAERSGVAFGIENDVPVKGSNAAQRREQDKRIGAGTMSSSGAACPCCGAISTLEDLRLEGRAGNLGETLAAVVVDTANGKSYRLPADGDAAASELTESAMEEAFSDLPHGRLREEIPNNPRRFATPLYGMRCFGSIFTSRQLLALAVLCRHTRSVRKEFSPLSYPSIWGEAIQAYLALVLNRQADYGSSICTWHNSGEKMRNTFARFALPMAWDYCEVNPVSDTSGNYLGALEWVSRVCDGLVAISPGETVRALQGSAQGPRTQKYDIVVTDPPYYDAIPYSDISNFFYVWLRRSVGDQHPDEFNAQLVPYDGELVMDRLHASLEQPRTKRSYERGMAQAFQAINAALEDSGRLVIVFAHKEPDAWESLVAAMIQAGFIVDESWPIQTEMVTRSNARGTASLASSVWLVCKKRPGTARPGWDNQVLEEMRPNILTGLREFWDAGIRGPDFVWAATGPALEAYSRHPVVKKANDAGKTMQVSEFLSHVRRMVVDFVVGRVLTGDGDGADLAAADRMDALTAYYLLHRHDFGLEEAPSGACILYATACGLSDSALESTWDLLARSGSRGGNQDDEEENEDADPDAEADLDSASNSGSTVKLKTWAQRKHKSMGYEAPAGQPVPLIDRVHRLMHLWRAGDVLKVDEYLDDHGLRRHELFRRLLQSLIELSSGGSDERALLESLSNHVQAKGARLESGQTELRFNEKQA